MIKFFSVLTLFTSHLLTQVSANDLLVSLGPGSNEICVERYAQSIIDANRSDVLGIHSSGYAGQRNFDDQFASTIYLAGMDSKLASFSDDGIDITITDLTSGDVYSEILKERTHGHGQRTL